MKKMCLVAGTLAVLTLPVMAVAPAGSEQNPVVTKEYVDQKLLQVYAYIESVSGENNQQDNVQTQSDDQSNIFRVVALDSGQKLFGENGCELIIRQGSGIIVASEKGGLADTTIGQDLQDKTNAPANHLLIVPVGDGRGIEAKSSMLIMVKGNYRII